MKGLTTFVFLVGLTVLARGAEVGSETGPDAALRFEMSYRGQAYTSGVLNCYPGARGIPFSDTKNIIPMTGSLWTPSELAADFKLRMATLPPKDRKLGIIVLLKTERCCTKPFRACSVTTAALEKGASPLVSRFLIYGAWIKSRDGDDPPGRLKIEEGADSWKNEAAGAYGFQQGPGATLAFIDPVQGSVVGRTDALKLDLYEERFVANQGHAPKLDAELDEMVDLLEKSAMGNPL
jgi:hypothetical protein